MWVFRDIQSKYVCKKFHASNPLPTELSSKTNYRNFLDPSKILEAVDDIRGFERGPLKNWASIVIPKKNY